MSPWRGSALPSAFLFCAVQAPTELEAAVPLDSAVHVPLPSYSDGKQWQARLGVLSDGLGLMEAQPASLCSPDSKQDLGSDLRACTLGSKGTVPATCMGTREPTGARLC